MAETKSPRNSHHKAECVVGNKEVNQALLALIYRENKPTIVDGNSVAATTQRLHLPIEEQEAKVPLGEYKCTLSDNTKAWIDKFVGNMDSSHILEIVGFSSSTMQPDVTNKLTEYLQQLKTLGVFILYGSTGVPLNSQDKDINGLIHAIAVKDK